MFVCAAVVIFNYSFFRVMAVREYLNSNYIDNVVGTFLTSFVLVVAMIFACVACRKKGQITVIIKANIS